MRAPSLHIAQIRLALAAALGLLVAGCGENEAPDDDLTAIHAPEIVRIVSAPAALAGANIPTLDPATMVDAEIQKAVGTGPRCEFHYTRAGRPVLAVSTQPDGAAAGGVVKLNGHLVVLAPAEAGGPAARFALLAEPVRVTVSPVAEAEAEDRDGVQSQPADMVFEIQPGLRVGYRGYLKCASALPVASVRR